MKCQKCEREVKEEKRFYYIPTNDPPIKKVCGICHYKHSLLMEEIFNNPRPEGRELIEYVRQRVTEWFSQPDEMLYFVIINNPHRNEVSMTNLGMHTEVDLAVKYAIEIINDFGSLGFDWTYKIYRIEDDEMKELDIQDENKPWIKLLEKGETSWLFDWTR